MSFPIMPKENSCKECREIRITQRVLWLFLSDVFFMTGARETGNGFSMVLLAGGVVCP